MKELADSVRHLVLLPGMDGTGKLLQRFAAAIGDTVETTVLSYPPDEKLSYEALIARIEQQLPRDGTPFALLAESFAGPIGLTLAQRRHPGLRALVLVVTFGVTPRKLLIQLTRVLPLSWILAQPVPCWLATRIMIGEGAPPEAQDALCGVLKEVEPEVIAQRFDEVRDLSLPFQPIDLPVLYLQATRDVLLPPEAATALRSYVPHMEVERVEGGHLVLGSQPERCAELVTRFLAKVA